MGGQLSKDELARLRTAFKNKTSTYERKSSNTFNAHTRTIPFAHLWTVEQLSELCSGQLSGHPEIESDLFSPPNSDKYGFTLSLYPKGDREEYQDYVGLYMQVKASPTRLATIIQRKFTLIKWTGESCNTKGGKN